MLELSAVYPSQTSRTGVPQAEVFRGVPFPEVLYGCIPLCGDIFFFWCTLRRSPKLVCDDLWREGRWHMIHWGVWCILRRSPKLVYDDLWREGRWHMVYWGVWYTLGRSPKLMYDDLWCEGMWHIVHWGVWCTLRSPKLVYDDLWRKGMGVLFLGVRNWCRMIYDVRGTWYTGESEIGVRWSLTCRYVAHGTMGCLWCTARALALETRGYALLSVVITWLGDRLVLGFARRLWAISS